MKNGDLCDRWALPDEPAPNDINIVELLDPLDPLVGLIAVRGRLDPASKSTKFQNKRIEKKSAKFQNKNRKTTTEH